MANNQEEEIEHLRQLIATYIRVLRKLELKTASFGLHCPPWIEVQIDDIVDKVALLEKKLAEKIQKANLESSHIADFGAVLGDLLTKFTDFYASNNKDLVLKTIPIGDIISTILSSGIVKNEANLVKEICRIINDLSLFRVDFHGNEKISITNLEIFKYIQYIYVMPDIVIVGSNSYVDTIESMGEPENIFIRKISISYVRNLRYPRINISIPSKAAVHPRMIQRLRWVQKPSLLYDLDFYTFAGRRIGDIKTRTMTSPYTMKGAHREVYLPNKIDVTLLVTTISDNKNKDLRTYIKVIDSTTVS